MNDTTPQLGERIAAAIPKAVLVLFALVCIVGLWRVLATIGLHVPLDPNEGWNAYLAAAAMAGHAYPDQHGYIVNNYPPLSFYVVGVLARLVGDNIIAGRMISLVAFVCVTAGVFQAARIIGCRAIHAALASLLLMAWLLVGSDYVGMNDPQMLGHALEIAALLLVLKKSLNDIAAAVLFAVAVFVKHNLVAMPLAVGLWLPLEDQWCARAASSVPALRLCFSGLCSFGWSMAAIFLITWRPRAVIRLHCWPPMSRAGLSGASSRP